MAERTKMPVSERAKQFAPFAAVTGLDILLREKERDMLREPKRILSEERAEEINSALARLKEGDGAAVTYYDGDGYAVISGVTEIIDEETRTLTLSGTEIEFDDIYEIS